MLLSLGQLFFVYNSWHLNIMGQYIYVLSDTLKGTRAARIVAALQPGCEEMEREWGNEEEMERKWGNGERLTLYISSFSLYFLPLSPFPPSLSISYIKMHHILLQNVKYGTFVANVTKISTYALWGNNSGSNLLRGSSAICAGLELLNSWGLGVELS